MLFEVSARSDTVNAGGSVDTVAQVQAGESVNNITNLVTWTCPVGSIQNGVYKAPNTVQTDTTIYLTASFRYAGRVYEASVPIKLLGSPQEMA